MSDMKYFEVYDLCPTIQMLPERNSRYALAVNFLAGGWDVVDVTNEKPPYFVDGKYDVREALQICIAINLGYDPSHYGVST